MPGPAHMPGLGTPDLTGGIQPPLRGPLQDGTGRPTPSHVTPRSSGTPAAADCPGRGGARRILAHRSDGQPFGSRASFVSSWARLVSAETAAVPTPSARAPLRPYGKGDPILCGNLRSGLERLTHNAHQGPLERKRRLDPYPYPRELPLLHRRSMQHGRPYAGGPSPRLPPLPKIRLRTWLVRCPLGIP